MTRDEALRLLSGGRRGVETWNRMRHANSGARIPGLYGADLSRADLGAVDLSKADLSGANLSGANLIGGKLSGADLTGAKLLEANLSGANLSGVEFGAAKLSGAILSEANLSGANLRGANLYAANLYGTKLIEATLIDAQLIGAELTLGNFTGANLTDADLSGANLRKANLIVANLRRGKLIEANLNGADLTRANLTEANLHGAKAIEASFRAAVLVEANLYGTTLNGADFRDAEMVLARIVAADAEGAVFENANIHFAQFDELNGLPKPPSALRKGLNGESIITGEEARAYFVRPATVEVVLTGEMSPNAIGSYYVFVGECEAENAWPNGVVFAGGNNASGRTFLRFQARRATDVLMNLPLLLQPFPLAQAIDHDAVLRALSPNELGNVIERALAKSAFHSIIAQKLREFTEYADAEPVAVRTDHRTVEIKMNERVLGAVRPGATVNLHLMLVEGDNVATKKDATGNRLVNYGQVGAAAVGDGANASYVGNIEQRVVSRESGAELAKCFAEMRALVAETMLPNADAARGELEQAEKAAKTESAKAPAIVAAWNKAKAYVDGALAVGAWIPETAQRVGQITERIRQLLWA